MYREYTISQLILEPSLTWPDHTKLRDHQCIQNEFSERCSYLEKGMKLPHHAVAAGKVKSCHHPFVSVKRNCIAVQKYPAL